MVKGQVSVRIPNPHGTDISIGLQARLPSRNIPTHNKYVFNNALGDGAIASATEHGRRKSVCNPGNILCSPPKAGKPMAAGVVAKPEASCL